jgi:hypothetical protein
MRGLLGAIAVGLLAGCGGVDADVDAETLNQQEQAQEIEPKCPTGQTEFYEWHCERACSLRGNVAHLWCSPTSNPSDAYYVGRTNWIICSDCF